MNFVGIFDDYPRKVKCVVLTLVFGLGLFLFENSLGLTRWRLVAWL